MGVILPAASSRAACASESSGPCGDAHRVAEAAQPMITTRRSLPRRRQSFAVKNLEHSRTPQKAAGAHAPLVFGMAVCQHAVSNASASPALQVNLTWFGIDSCDNSALQPNASKSSAHTPHSRLELGGKGEAWRTRVSSRSGSCAVASPKGRTPTDDCPGPPR